MKNDTRIGMAEKDACHFIRRRQWFETFPTFLCPQNLFFFRATIIEKYLKSAFRYVSACMKSDSSLNKTEHFFNSQRVSEAFQYGTITDQSGVGVNEHITPKSNKFPKEETIDLIHDE